MGLEPRRQKEGIMIPTPLDMRPWEVAEKGGRSGPVRSWTKAGAERILVDAISLIARPHYTVRRRSVAELRRRLHRGMFVIGRSV